MGHFYDDIPEYLVDWIRLQHMFWVATAPMSPTGHVNVSPKGVAGTFKVIDNRTVMYQDLSGSGSETISHLRENGRITVMFQEFEGAPRIVRLFGIGTWYERDSEEFSRYIPIQERLPGARAAIVVHVHKVGSSCGYAVPFFKFAGHRTQLLEHFEKVEAKDEACEDHRDKSGLYHYWGWKNGASIDGLPSLFVGEQYAKYFKLDPYALKPFAPGKDKRRIKASSEGKVQALVKDVGRNAIDIRFVLGLILGAVLMSLHSRC